METLRTSGPALRPTIPPVSGLRDMAGAVIRLDTDVIHLGWHPNPNGRIAWDCDPCRRSLVVGIGDGGLPGREVIKVRDHGGTYVSASSPSRVLLHTFDDYEWLAAETKAAQDLGDDRTDAWGKNVRPGIDLTRALFGGFYFERFQARAMTHYLIAAGLFDKPYAHGDGKLRLTEGAT